MLGLLLSAIAAVSLGAIKSLPLTAPIREPLSNDTLSAFPPSIATNLGQDVWPGLPFNRTVNWDLSLSIQRYGRPMDSIHTNEVLGAISRIERSFASDGSPDDNICPYIGGRGVPVAVHFVCTIGSPDVLSREQVGRILHTIWGFMLMYTPPMEIRYALIVQAKKQIAYLLLEWEH